LFTVTVTPALCALMHPKTFVVATVNTPLEIIVFV